MRKYLAIIIVMAGLVSLALAEGEVEVGDDFTAVVPLYPGAKVILSMKTDERTQVHLETADPSSAVIGFYKEEMKKKGWEAETEMLQAEGGTIILKENEKRLTVITFDTPGKATTAVLSLSAE